MGVTANSSVVVALRVFIVVSFVDISNDEDKDECSVELMRFSFVIEIEVNNDSVDSE
jgi:hypothetical protein